jgi:hypothetical protein
MMPTLTLRFLRKTAVPSAGCASTVHGCGKDGYCEARQVFDEALEKIKRLRAGRDSA